MIHYALPARLLHWIMALGFAFMWGCGYAMTSLVPDDSDFQESLFGLHISIGLTLLMLLIGRVMVRLLNAPPPLPEGLARWERVGARLGHFGLYLLPSMIILVGWAEVDFGGHGVEWFGLALPKIFPTMETLWGQDLGSTTEGLHRWLAYAMLVLAIAHVAAVIKHRWIDGHDVLVRMTFGDHRNS